MSGINQNDPLIMAQHLLSFLLPAGRGSGRPLLELCGIGLSGQQSQQTGRSQQK
ncbi:hypothetical protein D3C74_484740 [compost metagenome]